MEEAPTTPLIVIIVILLHHDDDGLPDDDEDGHGGGEGDGDPGEQEEEGGDKHGNLSPKPQLLRSEKEDLGGGLHLYMMTIDISIVGFID